MRTITETKEVYKFEELSDDAKERAVAQYLRYWTDSDWAEYPLDDAVSIAAKFGLRIDRKSIEWSVSPADAAFDGTYEYVKGCVMAVKREAPRDTELHDIVSRIAAAQRVLQFTGSASCSTHRIMQYVSVDCTERETGKVDDAMREVEDALRAFGQWIASRLEQEYEYVTSVDYISEVFDCNDYEFNEDGSFA